ncbi:MAG: type II secretion system protein [Microgenomates group bacterium]
MKRSIFYKTVLCHDSPKVGFSLIEILVTVTIVILLSVAALLLVSTQMASARDAQRKSDLHDLQTAFEEYYNDAGSYPPSDILQNCDSDDLRPYISMVPCDPKLQESYVYAPFPSDLDRTGGFRIYTILERGADRDIEKVCGLGCNVPTSLGGVNAAEYNYGVSAGVQVPFN